ncbi:MAG: hypothetical protein ACRECH_15760, partial [Nitrososphaerales archaeon]
MPDSSKLGREIDWNTGPKKANVKIIKIAAGFMTREPKYFFAQSNPKYGYMLFPHQIVPQDSLCLPSYCTRESHLKSKPQKWSTLGDHSEAFETGDRVILYQAGDPEWLRGFWGYGKIKKWGPNISISADRILST